MVDDRRVVITGVNVKRMLKIDLGFGGTMLRFCLKGGMSSRFLKSCAL